MEGLILILILGASIVVLFKSQMGPTYKAKPCKPHTWRLRDSEGWLPDPCEDTERWRGASIVCISCLTRPNQNTGPSEY